MVHKSAISIVGLWIAAMLMGSTVVSRASAQNGPTAQPQALNWAGIYALRGSDPSLTGAGVRVGVVCCSFTYNNDEPRYDYLPNMSHSCFQNAKLRFYDDGKVPASISPHETAIGSILFGEDAVGVAAGLEPFSYQGAVPAAEGRIYELRHFLTQYVYGQKTPGVDLVSASFGLPFEAWWTRGMDSMAEHQGLIIIASIGNGSNANDPPLYPGAGANAIGVGVISSVNTNDPATSLAHFALAYPDRSSLGPTDDGRCKPDLIAPGNCLVALADSSQGYTMSGNWSSFSTPVAAGVAGLLIQTGRQDSRLSDVLSSKGGNCLLKAILMNSAAKLPYWHKGKLTIEDDHEVPLDYAQGAGMIDAIHAHELLTAGRVGPGGTAGMGWDLNRLEDDRTLQRIYRIALSDPANKMLVATLVWNRHYEKEWPFKNIADGDSNLRLELWAVDPNNSSNDVLVDYSDSKVDNVEHIYAEALPGRLQYEVVVSWSDPNDRAGAAGERYAVAWSVEEKLAAGDDILWQDLNADGVVDEQDLKIVMTNLVVGQKSPDAYLIGDANADGAIDLDDIRVLNEHRNRQANWHTSVTN
jgi:hypothetical protein